MTSKARKCATCDIVSVATGETLGVLVAVRRTAAYGGVKGNAYYCVTCLSSAPTSSVGPFSAFKGL